MQVQLHSRATHLMAKSQTSKAKKPYDATNTLDIACIASALNSHSKWQVSSPPKQLTYLIAEGSENKILTAVQAKLKELAAKKDNPSEIIYDLEVKDNQLIATLKK